MVAAGPAPLGRGLTTLEVIMRRMILIVLTVITLVIATGPADAQNYPWCSQGGDGQTNCGFASYEQCRAGSRWCNPNPMYQPPTGAVQPRRGMRRTRG